MTTYTGRVWIDRWHDGDTFYGIIDPGWGLTLGATETKLQSVRIWSPPPNSKVYFDAPELGSRFVITDENRAGHEALDYADKIAPPLHFYDYTGHNRDKYGRPLMDISINRWGSSFAAMMLASGHADWKQQS